MDNKNQMELLSSGARAKALGNRIMSAEKLLRLADSNDLSDMPRALSEAGYRTEKGADIEEALSSMLYEVYSDFAVLMKDFPAAQNVLRLQYDCHNIKTAVKCLFCQREPEGLMIDVGSVKASDVILAVKNRDFSKLPANMGAAAKEAADAYAAAPDPQLIDTELDLACFADMNAAAENCGFEFPKEYAVLLSDLTNIKVIIRAISLGWSVKKTEKFCIKGSRIKPEWAEGGIGRFIEKLKYTDYSTLAIKLAALEDKTPSSTERLVKEYEAQKVRDTAYKSDNCADVFAYVLKRESEIKNIRIIVSGKKAKLDGQAIKSLLSVGLL